MLKTLALAASFAALAAVGAAQADQLDDIMGAKVLRCGTFADVPPFAAPDPKTREMVGFDVDLCNAIAKRWGVTAKITPLSVEARVPMLDLELMRFVESLPSQLRLRGRTHKYLYRKAVAAWLPPEVLHRKLVEPDEPEATR